MPAVLEVEHSTGVTSGINRMKNFRDRIPPIMTRYVIVAPDEVREKVVTEAIRPMFRDMNIRFFPYSAVEELFFICQRRKLEELDCYMEPVVVT